MSTLMVVEGSPRSTTTPAPAARAVSATKPSTLARATGSAALFAVVGLAMTLLFAMSAPVLLGYKSLTMLTGSMAPAIPAGSVVIDKTIRPLEARPGDVLTFVDPDHPDRLLTHRLRAIEVHDPLVHMVTRGDANETDEQWTVPIDGTIGRVEYRIPAVGYVRSWVHQADGRTTMLALLSSVGVWTLLDVWLPAPLFQLLGRRLNIGRGARHSLTPDQQP